ncbi:MAG: hypothetical protein WCF75_20645, partial [Pseudolabrys sp.]
GLTSENVKASRSLQLRDPTRTGIDRVMKFLARKWSERKRALKFLTLFAKYAEKVNDFTVDIVVSL